MLSVLTNKRPEKSLVGHLNREFHGDINHNKYYIIVVVIVGINTSPFILGAEYKVVGGGAVLCSHHASFLPARRSLCASQLIMIYYYIVLDSRHR